MALDMFIKIGDLAGGSTRAGHEGETEIMSYAWGLMNNGTMHQGGGGGAGKVAVQDLSITKYVDKITPELIKNCCKGTHFPEAKITAHKAGGESLPYLVITLKKVMIASLTTGGAGGGDLITESVTLNFAEFQVDFQPQKDDGTKDGGAVSATWKIPQGTE